MRILIVDDEPAMHDRYARAFAAEERGERTAGAPADEAGPSAARAVPELVHCAQVGDAVAALSAARAAGTPFHIAFVGARVRHLRDGRGARDCARRLRLIDDAIEIVVVADDVDRALAGIGCAAGSPDRLFPLSRRFEAGEVRRVAAVLEARWTTDRERAARIARLEAQVAELAANESRAMHLATHDLLTDAPNRLAFQRAMATRARLAGPFAIAMVDLDRFKLVNDTLGHLAGDALIRAICIKLQCAVPIGATVARLGGDEFGILFDTAGDGAAVAACDRVLAACAGPISVFGHSVQTGASAGIVVIEGGAGCDPHGALRRADLALNAAKRAGKGVTRLFDETMDDGIRVRRRIEDGLSRAIEAGELSLAYQPIVERDRFAIAGFEALLRWNTAEYGPISPATFLPIAEESTLIHELGDWVLARAITQLGKWPGQYVSINFSPRQFRRPGFVERLSRAVRQAGIAPARIQIEITETAIFDDAERAAATLRTLRAEGFRTALDDFGTGYSSLHDIRTFALDCLKIDRSFIDGMGRERESAAIVHSIIHLGRALGLGIVAEGVETAAQVQALRLAGASHLQGFFVAHPVDAEDAAAMAVAGMPGDDAGTALPMPRTGTRG